MSCIVLDIELADKNFIKELGNFVDGRFQGYPFCPPKNYKRTKQLFWCTRNVHGIVWSSGRLDYSELSNHFPRALKGEYFAKGTEKIIGTLVNKEVENLEDQGCPEV